VSGTLVAAPVVLPWVAAPLVALADGRRRVVGLAAGAVLVATLALTGVLTAAVLTDGPRQVVGGDWPPGVGIVLRADALGCVFALTSLIVLVAVLLQEAATGARTREFPALVLLMAAGLNGLFLTGDIFNFYVFFELSMIAAYVLTLYGGARRESAGALIFATVNLLGSFVFLLGVAAIYHVTGTLEMTVVADELARADPAASLMIAVTAFVAFGVKLGLFPFHYWLPPVYTSADPAVAAALSGALANIGAYGLLRFGGGLLGGELRFAAEVVIAIGVASILYGGLQAVSRRRAEEVVAYSAIGQVGYVLVALGVGGPVGYSAAVLYSVVNALNKALLFLATGLRGWLVGAAFAIGAFSVIGLPPFAGFLGKVALFRAAVEEDSVALVALIFLGGALSFVYMLQAYQHEFWAGRRDSGDEASPRIARAVLVAAAALVLALGVWPEPLVAVSEEAAAALPGGAR
jgi:multicomponent Na+:H+ antiporter subunit D